MAKRGRGVIQRCCGYFLKRGEGSRVEELALEAAWVFDAQGIRREALASLKLFCEAAEKRELSVELIRRVRAEVEGYR